MPEHIRDVLKSKRLEVFRAMLAHCKYGDEHICDDITKGFDLMGQLPDSGVSFRSGAHTPPSRRIRSAKSASKHGKLSGIRRGPWLTERLLRKFIKQLWTKLRKDGWLAPLASMTFPDGASLTRRFGILQTSSSSDGSQTKKVRPIDDFTESLINMTNGCNEKISIHGVDTIASGVVHRLKLWLRL